MPSGVAANFWAIELGGGLVSWNGAEWSTLALPSGLSAALLTVDADGTVWVLAADAAGSFFKIIGGTVTPLPDGLPGAASLGAGGGSTVWATAAAGNADYHLCTYGNNAWQTAASPPVTNMDWNNYPQVSVGQDGGVWLLDGSGNAWAPGTMNWAAKGKSVSFQSLAAANVNNSAVTDADNDAAWGVTAAGEFRRSFGNGWAEPYAALPNGAAAASVSVGRDGSVWAIDNEGGRLCRQAPSSVDPAPALDGPWTMAAGRNGGGKFYLFSIDAGGQAWVAARGAGANDWLGWTALVSPEPLAMLVTGLDQNQTTDEVFCLSSGGQALHAWEDAGAPTGWSQLTPLGASGQPPGTILSWLATGADANLLLHVFGLGVDNNVWVISQQSGSSTGWSDWSVMPSFGGGSIIALSTGNDPGGELEVFALADTGIAWHSWQDAQAPSGWSDWAVLGATGQPAGVSLTALVTANQPSGPLYAFAIGGDGNVYAINGQSSSPTGWSDWYSLGSIAGVTPLSLQAGAGADGIFSLFLQGSDGAVYATCLPQGSADWSGWAPLGASGTERRGLAEPDRRGRWRRRDAGLYGGRRQHLAELPASRRRHGMGRLGPPLRAAALDQPRCLTPPFEQLVGVHVVAPRHDRSRRARLHALGHDLTLQRLGPLTTLGPRGASLGVHQAGGGHFRCYRCHAPIIAPSDDQRQAPLTEPLRSTPTRARSRIRRRVENIRGIALQRWATRPTTITARRGTRIFLSAIAMILSVTGSKHFERQSTRRDARNPRKMDAMSYFQSVPGPGTSGV